MKLALPAGRAFGATVLAVSLLSASTSTSAAPVGEPLPDPDIGVLSLFLGGGSDSVPEVDGDCGDRRRCDAEWDRTDYSAEVQLSPLRGVGIFAGFARRTEVVTEADYRGKGSLYSVGLRGALPLGDLFSVAANARLDIGANEGVEGVAGGTERSTYQLSTVTLLAAAGGPDRGLTVWAGPQLPWYWQHQLQPLGDVEGALELPMELEFPVTGVLGLALTSSNLGLPWRRGGEISIGIEGRAGAENGFSVWGGFHY